MEAINDLSEALKHLDTPEGVEFARKVKTLRGLKVLYWKESVIVNYEIECPYCERKIYSIRSRYRTFVEHFSDEEYKLHQCAEYENATPELHAEIMRSVKIKKLWGHNRPKNVPKIRENLKDYFNFSIWDNIKAEFEAKL